MNKGCKRCAPKNWCKTRATLTILFPLTWSCALAVIRYFNLFAALHSKGSFLYTLNFVFNPIKSHPHVYPSYTHNISQQKTYIINIYRTAGAGTWLKVSFAIRKSVRTNWKAVQRAQTLCQQGQRNMEAKPKPPTHLADQFKTAANQLPQIRGRPIWYVVGMCVFLYYYNL